VEPLARNAPTNPSLHATLLRVYDVVGMVALASGDARGALESHGRQLRMLEALPDSERRTPRRRRSLSVAHEHIADAQVELGDLAGALESNRRALAYRAALSAEFPHNADYRHLVAVSLYWEAEVLAKMGRTREALDEYRKGLAIGEELAAADPKANLADIAGGLVKVGDMLSRLGAHGEALASYRRAQAASAAGVAADSASLWKRSSLIETHAKVCKALASLSRRSEALGACARTASLMDKTTVEPTNAEIRAFFAGTYSELGEAYATLAAAPDTPRADRRLNWRAARDMYQRSLDVWRDMAARGIVSRPDAGKAEVASRAVARCETALLDLGGR